MPRSRPRSASADRPAGLTRELNARTQSLADAAAHGSHVGVVGSVVALVPAVFVELRIGPGGSWSVALAAVSVHVMLIVLAIVKSEYQAYEVNTDPEVRQKDRDLETE